MSTTWYIQRMMELDRMKANDIQHGGSHYKGLVIQPWDYIISNNIPYLEGNIIKYVTRWRGKGGVEDLKKAQHYLQKLIEVAYAEKDQPAQLAEVDKSGNCAGPGDYDSDG